MVLPLVSPSVTSYVFNLLGASYAVYTAVFCGWLVSFQAKHDAAAGHVSTHPIQLPLRDNSPRHQRLFWSHPLSANHFFSFVVNQLFFHV